MALDDGLKLIVSITLITVGKGSKIFCLLPFDIFAYLFPTFPQEKIAITTTSFPSLKNDKGINLPLRNLSDYS